MFSKFKVFGKLKPHLMPHFDCLSFRLSEEELYKVFGCILKHFKLELRPRISFHGARSEMFLHKSFQREVSSLKILLLVKFTYICLKKPLNNKLQLCQWGSNVQIVC